MWMNLARCDLMDVQGDVMRYTTGTVKGNYAPAVLSTVSPEIESQYIQLSRLKLQRFLFII